MSFSGCFKVFILFLGLIMAHDVGKFGDLDVEHTAFFLCDMQDFFEPDIKNFGDVVATSNKMIAAASIFKIPVFASEHDPKVFGKTVKSITLNKDTFVFQKNTFSMCTPELKERLKQNKNKINTVVIFGVETHICIEQTIIDLLKEGYQVHVLADGVSSRSLMDRALALQRLQMIGAFVETTESVMYKLLKTTHHPHNQAITDLNVDLLPDEFGQKAIKQAKKP